MWIFYAALKHGSGLGVLTVAETNLNGYFEAIN